MAALLTAAAFLGTGCSEQETWAPVPDAAVAPLPWELGEDPATYDAWQQGTVMQPRGETGLEPCPDVRVELWTVTPDGRSYAERLATTASDEQGRFRIGPGPRDRWALRLFKEGFAEGCAGRGIDIPGAMGVQSGDEHEVGVRPGRPFAGTVVDAAGEPLAGVLVRATAFAFAGLTTTDAQGHFQLTIPPGPAQLWVDGEDHVSELQAITVPEGPPAPPVQVTAEPAEPLRGWVIEGVSERRVPGAIVLSERDPTNWTRTDANGEFALKLHRMDRVAAFADGLGWRSVRQPTAGQVEIRLAAGRAVTGRVVDADGAPVAGARIYGAAPRMEAGLDRMLGPSTGPDGRFECTWFPAPPEGVQGTMGWIATKPGLGISAPQGFGADAPDRRDGLVLTLSGERTIRGEVTDADGTGVPSGVAELRWEMPELPDAQRHAMRLTSDLAAPLSDQGTFAFEGIPCGYEGGLVVTTSVFRLTKEIDPEACGEEVHAFHLPPGEPISGVLALGGGEALPPGSIVRAELLKRGPGGYRLTRQVEVAADGRFVFQNLPQGRYQLLGEVPGYEAAGLVAEAGATDVELRPVRMAHLTFRLVFPDDVPQADRLQPFQLAIDLADDPLARPRVVDVPLAEGPRVADVPLIRPGDYRIRVRGGLWRGEISSLAIADGDRREVEVPLVRTLGVPARLTSPDGTGLGGVRVVLVPRPVREGASPQTAISEPDGALTLSGLSAGTWVAHVVVPGHPVLDVPFSVPWAGPGELELRLPAAGGLRIVAARRSGETLEIRTVDGDPAYGQTSPDLPRTFRFRFGEDGVVEVAGLPAGPVDLLLAGPAEERVRKRVEVPAGDVAEVRPDEE